MLDLKQIESFYPENLRVFKRNLLREYLQYKVLEVIFDSEFGQKLSFMGGTAIHIVYQNNRFSENLDFDNLGLGKKDFERLVELIKRKLELQGYTIEIKNVFKGAYRCYLRFTDLLFATGVPKHRGEKLLIQLDTEPQGFDYQSDKCVFRSIWPPIPMKLATPILCLWITSFLIYSKNSFIIEQ